MRRLIRCLLLLLYVTLGAAPALLGSSFEGGAAWAQQRAQGPDYERWELIASRAEDAIDASRASTAALEEMRDQLADWRDIFFSAQNLNADAIATARAQLQALGPPPEDGTSEDSEIAEQRERLNEELARLRAPRQRAEIAYGRADGMIQAIDRIIRERQTEEFLELGPSPLNPEHWPDGISALVTAFEGVRQEVARSLASETQYTETRQKLPITVLLAIIGVILMVRGRYWVELLVRMIMARDTLSVRWIVTLAVSAGEIIVPFIGFIAFSEALYISGLVGLKGDLILKALTPSVLIFLVARWLALRCFPRSDKLRLPLILDAPDRKAGRLYGGALGFVIAVFYFIKRAAEFDNWSVEASNVILFPVIVLAGLLLARLARILVKHSDAAAQSEDYDTYRNRLTRLLARVLYILAIVSPLLAAIGYFKAAVSMMLPSLLSLLLLAALLVIQRIIAEIYVLLTRHRGGTSDELAPVLMGFGIVILSVPLFALIWGARVADLSEMWSKFTRGFTIGDFTLSPTIFLTLGIVFTMGYVLTRLLQGTLRNTVLPKTKMDPGGANALVSGIGYVGIFLAAIIAITAAGIDLSSLAIVAGALSVGIGFGLQNIVSNFVSGIILLIERPISQGDWIEVGGLHGTVKEISVRSTRIETFDRSDLIIPNADFVSGTVTNYTRGNTVGRVIVPVGVAYGTDTRKVEKILLEVGEGHPMVLANPAPYVVFRRFGADSLDFEIRAILRDVNWILRVQSEMNHEIARRFAEEGIEIPFAQRDIWLRNPEALTQGRGEPRGDEISERAPDEAASDRTAPAQLTDEDAADGSMAPGDGEGDSR
ncbi:DUF3772 domain-containing protein [Roseovarius sp. SCSIO 43702]|uniref:DUF3772 domain-containing protein n=1 Tax=Roseovarius sp. SCSIO 43702 TaxID=2823043 RepID=UPI001C73B2A8|nr:DUF3772 domain-containing protein [Roseovarius sp. SCSIO 43702]QYX57957.1 DUF3772 domain-containing protein [Roseovarius sp. SCSIO 43702]